MTPPLVAAPAVPDKNDKALAAIEQARAFVITNNDDYAAVDAFCVQLKALEKEVDAAYDEHIKAAFDAHKSLVAKKKKYAEPITTARTIAKQKLIDWEVKMEAVRREQEAAQRAAAQKAAEDEALAKAARAAEFGDDKTADAIISEPIAAAPVVVEKLTPKAQTVTRTVWTYEVTDPALVPREYLMLDDSKIGGVIRATKGSVQIPGIRAVSRKV
jgi:hypothetical protein